MNDDLEAAHARRIEAENKILHEIWYTYVLHMRGYSGSQAEQDAWVREEFALLADHHGLAEHDRDNLAAILEVPHVA